MWFCLRNKKHWHSGSVILLIIAKQNDHEEKKKKTALGSSFVSVFTHFSLQNKNTQHLFVYIRIGYKYKKYFINFMSRFFTGVFIGKTVHLKTLTLLWLHCGHPSAIFLTPFLPTSLFIMCSIPILATSGLWSFPRSDQVKRADVQDVQLL